MRITDIKEVKEYLIKYSFDTKILDRISNNIIDAINERFIKKGSFDYGVILTSEIDKLSPGYTTQKENNTESEDLYLGVVELDENQKAIDTLYGVILKTNKKYIVDTLSVSHDATH